MPNNMMNRKKIKALMTGKYVKKINSIIHKITDNLKDSLVVDIFYKLFYCFTMFLFKINWFLLHFGNYWMNVIFVGKSRKCASLLVYFIEQYIRSSKMVCVRSIIYKSRWRLSYHIIFDSCILSPGIDKSQVLHPKYKYEILRRLVLNTCI